MLERLHGLTHPGRLFAKSTNGNILEEANNSPGLWERVVFNELFMLHTEDLMRNIATSAVDVVAQKIPRKHFSLIIFDGCAHMIEDGCLHKYIEFLEDGGNLVMVAGLHERKLGELSILGRLVEKDEGWCTYECAGPGPLGYKPLSSWYVCEAGFASPFGSAT